MQSTFRRRGIIWDLDLDEGIDLSIYLFGAYEGSLLCAYGSFLKHGDVVFDIGANIGAHTLHFARLVGASGAVHAFEPTDYAIKKLRGNLALNPGFLAHVSTHQIFLGKSGDAALPETVCSSWPVNRWTTDIIDSDLNEQHLGRGKALRGAKAMTADHFCSTEGIARLDLVKLDVDGNELDVLRGFRECLIRFRPRIIVEFAPYVHHEGLPTDTFNELVLFLTELGYDFFDTRTRKPIPNNGSELRKFIGGDLGLNALLLPRLP